MSEKYGFTENQSHAIVEMKLGKLAGLEKIEIQNEKKELLELIDSLNAILADILSELLKRLNHLVSVYGDERRTEIVNIEAAPKEEKEEQTPKLSLKDAFDKKGNFLH